MTQELADSITSALSNCVILVGVPFVFYFAFHKLRHKRGLGEILSRAGLRMVVDRRFGYCLGAAVVVVVCLVLIPLPMESLTQGKSAWVPFKGLGFGGTAVVMALLYGVLKTGFCEEFLFRGLIAGSLARCMSLKWANFVQALIFLAPHLAVLKFAPEMWPMLFFVFGIGLFCGWVRIKSDSIAGPWLIHAAANVTMGLLVAIRTAA